jgi:general stress protein YciG
MGKKRGFGSMDGDLQKEIASKGGRAAHERGKAHEFTAEEARAAGKKGGLAISRDRGHMARIGAKGGAAKRANRETRGG